MNPAESTASRARWCVLRAFALIIPLWLSVASAVETMRCPLADGFDFPVGKPDASGYRKARGYYPGGHRGEDWNGSGGGDSDLGDPIYCIGGGVVVLSENVGVGWGNVIIVRHAYRGTGGKIEMVDSLYGHLLARQVKLYQLVGRGQQIGTMGSNNGMYPAHLHLEIRKDLRVGMNRSSFPNDYSVYHSPTKFINEHRRLSSSLQKFEMPVNTFAPYGKSLADMDGSSSGRGLNIPVFPSAAPGSQLPGLVLTPRGGKPESSGAAPTSPSPAPRAAVPASRLAPNPPAPPPGITEDDFWSRLKSKLKQGKLTDERR